MARIKNIGFLFEGYTVKAIILGAGFGTRLKPLTDKIAKPLIDVSGRPIIDYIIDKVEVLPDIDEILVICNQRFFSDFQAWLRAKDSKTVRVLNDGTVSDETKRGAVGDIRFALEHTDGTPELLIIGGDNIFAFELYPLLDSFRQKGNSIGVLDVKSRDLAKLYATVEMTPEGLITGMIEKPDKPPTTMVSICVYAYGSSIRSRIEQYAAVTESMDMTGEFASWLCTVEPVYGCSLEGAWFDISDPKSLEMAREAFNVSKRES